MAPTQTPLRIENLSLPVVAHHEAAHAVIALTTGGRVPKARIWPADATHWQGWVDMEFRDNPEGEHAGALALLAGAHAERVWLDRHDVPPASWPHDIDASSQWDRSLVQECLRRIPRNQRPLYRAVDREAERLVARHWDRIEHVAERLIDAKTLHHVRA
ncbi:hypothetical protein AB0A74_02860 [Saccharothrix sp. NPDC042600]|uniref:hypothetical protein n=1 Tax=Saccharothrix TaxID=2071 RepID=UPI003407B1DB|nr:hypothetical protein GCM10017745_67190 [Saccharothrix mutabilis subsp. capreolus]